jgi:hypothetical protein
MANPIGIYFPGLTQEETNEVRRAFADIAASHGYLATRSKHVRGSPGALMMAIASGEVITVLLPDEQRTALAQFLRIAANEHPDGIVAEGAGDLADALDGE